MTTATRHNPHRLYRNREAAKIAGVCAGIADYFGFNLCAVRALTIISVFIFFPVTLIAYVLLALILPSRPESLYQSPEQETFWREVSNAPADVFGDLRHRFRNLESRLRRMEAYVTSSGFEIDRELRRESRNHRSGAVN